ncbi:PilZ domain-containing protein [Devosia lucknowensis]|nr:PilZ domain-containing protein [Devosia lucknowensis]
MPFGKSPGANASPLLLERRIAPRRDTYIEATISIGFSKMPCIIRNVSDSGAKLEVAKVNAVPDRFTLNAPGHRPQLCRVVWRALKEVGVAYQD